MSNRNDNPFTEFVSLYLIMNHPTVKMIMLGVCLPIFFGALFVVLVPSMWINKQLEDWRQSSAIRQFNSGRLTTIYLREKNRKLAELKVEACKDIMTPVIDEWDSLQEKWWKVDQSRYVGPLPAPQFVVKRQHLEQVVYAVFAGSNSGKQMKQWLKENDYKRRTLIDESVVGAEDFEFGATVVDEPLRFTSYPLKGPIRIPVWGQCVSNVPRRIDMDWGKIGNDSWIEFEGLMKTWRGDWYWRSDIGYASYGGNQLRSMCVSDLEDLGDLKTNKVEWHRTNLISEKLEDLVAPWSNLYRTSGMRYVVRCLFEIGWWVLLIWPTYTYSGYNPSRWWLAFRYWAVLFFAMNLVRLVTGFVLFQVWTVSASLTIIIILLAWLCSVVVGNMFYKHEQFYIDFVAKGGSPFWDTNVFFGWPVINNPPRFEMPNPVDYGFDPPPAPPVQPYPSDWQPIK